ncbi:MAG: hydroxyacylglutathione hydrolase [Methanobacterium sp. PtaU1.Bin242]|nr:MAG: hydroxyacylglutathione hydrolase [Methanobacterium sp. PtaU1.Bin242]
MKITDKVYALDSTRGNYAYIIYDDDVILIDTGRPGQGKGILKELNSMNIRPEDIKHILITHHDVDHIGNLALLEKVSDARIWASKEDIPYIIGDKNRPGIKRMVSILMRTGKPGNISTYPQKQEIEDIKIIPTPGHTPGHVCLLYEDVLLAGDLLRNSKGQLKPLASFMNDDETALRKSIDKIDQFSFKWVCPAHGEPIKIDNNRKQILRK